MVLKTGKRDPYTKGSRRLRPAAILVSGHCVSRWLIERATATDRHPKSPPALFGSMLIYLCVVGEIIRIGRKNASSLRRSQGAWNAGVRSVMDCTPECTRPRCGGMPNVQSLFFTLADWWIRGKHELSIGNLVVNIRIKHSLHSNVVITFHH